MVEYDLISKGYFHCNVLILNIVWDAVYDMQSGYVESWFVNKVNYFLLRRKYSLYKIVLPDCLIFYDYF